MYLSSALDLLKHLFELIKQYVYVIFRQQVDCVQPILKEEQTPTTRFQSIGVQVEDGRP